MLLAGLALSFWPSKQRVTEEATLKAVSQLIEEKARQTIATPSLAEPLTIACQADRLESEALRIAEIVRELGGTALTEKTAETIRLLVQIDSGKAHALREEITGKLLPPAAAGENSQYIEVLLTAQQAK